MKKFLLIALISLFPVSSFASQCPTDMAAIDEFLATSPDLDEEVLAEVEELRATGEELHNAGDHGGSVEALGQAMELLGIE